jgi:hypothetical protein
MSNTNENKSGRRADWSAGEGGISQHERGFTPTQTGLHADANGAPPNTNVTSSGTKGASPPHERRFTRHDRDFAQAHDVLQRPD